MRFVGPLLCAVLGCGQGPIGSGSSALTDAMEDRGHPSVGRYLFSTDGSTQNGGCTATVIGRRTLLTAGHCAGYDMNEIELGDPPVRHAVARDVVHPEWDSGRAWERDLALVITVDPLTAAPMPVERRPAVIGEPVVLVGFGETVLGALDNGVKRVAMNDVESLEGQYFVTQGTGQGEGNGCRGDSGGPTLVESSAGETILGVMSYVPGLGSGCGDETWITRLDLYSAWLVGAAGGDVVFADHVPPQVQILGPEAGEVTSPIQLQVSATDDQAITEMVVSIDGVPYASVASATYVESIDLGVGPRRILALAKDAAGNEASAELRVIVVPKPAAPAPEEESGCGVVGPPGIEALWLGLYCLWLIGRRRRLVPREFGAGSERSR